MASRRLTGLFAAFAVVALGAIFIVLVASIRDNRPRGDIDRWADREILLPGATYRLPNVDGELLEPRFYYFVDPSEPLSSDVVDALQPDLPDALRNYYTVSVEDELEAMLFEE